MMGINKGLLLSWTWIFSCIYQEKNYEGSYLIGRFPTVYTTHSFLRTCWVSDNYVNFRAAATQHLKKWARIGMSLISQVVGTVLASGNNTLLDTSMIRGTWNLMIGAFHGIRAPGADCQSSFKLNITYSWQRVRGPKAFSSSHPKKCVV